VASSYDVRVRDINLSNKIFPIALTQPLIGTSTLTVVSQPTCGNSDGVLQLSSSGGVFPKTYTLYADTTSPYTTCGGSVVFTGSSSTNGTTFNISGLTSIGYCLEVTDANGCVTNSGITVLNEPAQLYKYQVLRCDNAAAFYMTSPDLLPSPFLGGTKAIKIDNVCYQVDYYISTTCTQETLHLSNGQNSTVWTSCNDCTSGGGGAQI